MRTFFAAEKKVKNRGLTLQEVTRLGYSVLKMCCCIVVDYFLKEDLRKYRLRERIMENRLMGRYPFEQRLD